jgi:membrane protein DedA with SNARE-associated domain
MESILTSYIGIALFLILTGCGLPLPEELGIIAAGVLAGTGKLHIAWAFAACMAGCLIGDSIMWAIGRYFGRRLVRRGSWTSKLITPEIEGRAERMIRRHGLKIFFVARFLVGVRGPMYVTAGILRVPFSRFLLVDGICALVVVAVVFSLGYMFGKPISEFFHRLRHWELVLTLALVGVAALAGLWIWLHHRAVRRRLQRGAAAPPGEVDAESESHDDESPTLLERQSHSSWQPSRSP